MRLPKINPKVRVRIEGLDELIKATREIADQAMPGLDLKSREAAERVLLRAQKLAPVKTGLLRASLKVKKMNMSKHEHAVGYKVTFGTGTAYGVPVELGHRLVFKGRHAKKASKQRVKPRPFLRPAADQLKDEVKRMLAKQMDLELKKWGSDRR